MGSLIKGADPGAPFIKDGGNAFTVSRARSSATSSATPSRSTSTRLSVWRESDGFLGDRDGFLGGRDGFLGGCSSLGRRLSRSSLILNELFHCKNKKLDSHHTLLL